MKLVETHQHLSQQVLGDLLACIKRHRLSVSGALAHLLGLAAGIGKCYQWGVGTDAQAVEQFTANARAAWEVCPKNLIGIGGEPPGGRQ